MKKYQLFSKSDEFKSKLGTNKIRGGIGDYIGDSVGSYLGTINNTLRLTDAPGGEERNLNALQYLIDQHIRSGTIDDHVMAIPVGETKKSKIVTFKEICPKAFKKAKKVL